MKNMSKIQTKKISILNKNRYYTSRGFVITPVKEYYEELPRILQLISQGAKIEEILPNGTRVPLTEQNFDKDNSYSLKNKKPITPTLSDNADKNTSVPTSSNSHPPKELLSRKEKRKMNGNNYHPHNQEGKKEDKSVITEVPQEAVITE